MSFLPKDDVYLFNIGNAEKAYMLFGCHYIKEFDSFRFCVWAPHADAVYLVGDFNFWNECANPMERNDGGVFCTYVKNMEYGSNYKYLIVHGNERILKSDPFAFYSEIRPRNASKVWDLSYDGWTDEEFLKNREQWNFKESPVSIYELHLSSWMKDKEKAAINAQKMDVEHISYFDCEDDVLNYRDIAKELIPYIKKMGYTHVEFLPLTEYPFDMSWGYQVTGYYSVTSRYGTPQDFMYLVNELHNAGIGVILDWVPAHFPKDAFALARFDGECLYESADPVIGEHKEWGTLTFDYKKPEITSFLISSAMFFADIYHVDGIRIDAVSAMLYLDFNRDSEYIRQRYGTTTNWDAVEFLKHLNYSLHNSHKGFLTIAEEATAYPYVTKRQEDGGLGFSLKWNMGYMHDTLDFMELDPIYRKYHHGSLFNLMEYAFSENYVLAYSHDEVVYEKKSMIDKMSGDYYMKFASLRALYGYTFAHPGKKLMFMGSEFAQFDEWNYQKELEWFLPEQFESHRKMQTYVADLNEFYKTHRPFYEIDDSFEGFRWLNTNDGDISCLSFVRKSKYTDNHTEKIICACNFANSPREDYYLKLECGGSVEELLNSDNLIYGGGGMTNDGEIQSFELDGVNYVRVKLPPLSTVYFRYNEVY